MLHVKCTASIRYVSKFLRRTERKDAECGLKNLYVTNLDDDITEDFLKDKFSNHGKVSSVVIIKDEKGKLKGYGFVNFDSHEGAKQAIETLDGELLGINFASFPNFENMVSTYSRSIVYQ